MAIAIPIDPPMLRSMLKRPVALPISSREMVEVVMVASGTNTKLSAKPVSMIGNQQRVGADVEIHRAEDERADAEAEKSRGRAACGCRCASPECRSSGEPINEPMPRGPTTSPAVNAV